MRSLSIIFLLILLNTTFFWAQSPEKNNQYELIKSFQLSKPSIISSSIFFEDTVTIQFILNMDDVTFHYTLDGTMPSKQSPLYNQNITLKKSSVVQVRAFHPDYKPSEISKLHYFKINKKIKIKHIKLSRNPSENYPGIGKEGLVDLIKGSHDFRSNKWMGFNGGALEILIELEKRTCINQVTASLIQDHNSWIFTPKLMEVYTSKNGKKFKKVDSLITNCPTIEANNGFQFLSSSFKKEKSTFVKIKLISLEAIPDWHPGNGSPTWFFIDEIIIE